MPTDDKENARHASNTSCTAKRSPCTPHHAAKPIRVVQPGPSSDDLPSMAELLAWKNPPASFCAMVFGSAGCLVASFAFSRQAPFLSGTLKINEYTGPEAHDVQTRQVNFAPPCGHRLACKVLT
jgi:hypothetical protein